MEKDIEIIGFPKEDYMPLKDYDGWRVAVLKHCENTNLEKISWMRSIWRPTRSLYSWMEAVRWFCRKWRQAGNV